MSQSTRPPIANFISLQPTLSDYVSLYMLEYFGTSVVLSSPHPVDQLTVQIWTNAVNKFNSEGTWHSLPLHYQQHDDSGRAIFNGGFLLTSSGTYDYTYRVGLKGRSDWHWAGGFGHNGHLHVDPPSPKAQWTQKPDYVEILDRVFVGNFIAASQAEKLGIDAVLNLGEELALDYSSESGITYQKLGTPDGARNPISDAILQEAVTWIDAQRQQGKRRILVHCRAGIGRSGSVGVAYCFYKHADWTYEQALDYVWSKKPNVYPHQNLRASLERLFR